MSVFTHNLSWHVTECRILGVEVWHIAILVHKLIPLHCTVWINLL